MKNELFEFPIQVYGQITKYNDVLSKARCRIFYKYENRNGSYITDEFAEKLLSTLPYTPLKGIYEEDDFTDHGEERDEGRIYGIVPENPNIQWEEHQDEDGVTRNYACADVLLFTAIYKEANEIVGKKQSMEIYGPSIKFHYETFHGQKYFVFDDGCFLGLQVLGDTTLPCFEGASFYTLQKSIEDILQQIKNYQKEDNRKMPNALDSFKLSDDQKYELLWNLLNPKSEEGERQYIYSICAVYDEYALAFQMKEGNYERIYYTKNDETDEVTIDKKEIVYIIEVTQEEKETVETLRKLNGDTYDLVEENLLNANENAQKIVELNDQISTLNQEIENKNNQFNELSEEKSKLENEVESLNSYKLNIENQQKEAVIVEYVGKLSDEVLNTYREKFSEYSVLDLDKELTYELKKANPSFFSLEDSKDNEGMVPKDDNLSGLEAILAKYKNK
jgi:hypothetical protein